MTEEGPRRRVTYAQLEILWEFLNKNKNIATGYNKTTQAREFSRRMWETVARLLNSQGDGALKDWKGWCKYWNDFKSKLKSKVAAARASHNQTGGGPSTGKPLTEMDKKFLQILGDTFGSGLPGIRVEPFDQEIEHANTLEPTGTLCETPMQLQEIIEDDSEIISEMAANNVQPSTSNSQINIVPTVISPPPPAVTATTPHPPPPGGGGGPPPATSQALQSPRGTPRHRRRVRRREPPMTQEASRRTVIGLSQQRIQIEERRNELISEVILELRDIRRLLSNSRSAAPATTDE